MQLLSTTYRAIHNMILTRLLNFLSPASSACPWAHQNTPHTDMLACLQSSHALLQLQAFACDALFCKIFSPFFARKTLIHDLRLCLKRRLFGATLSDSFSGRINLFFVYVPLHFVQWRTFHIALWAIISSQSLGNSWGREQMLHKCPEEWKGKVV